MLFLRSATLSLLQRPSHGSVRTISPLLSRGVVIRIQSLSSTSTGTTATTATTAVTAIGTSNATSTSNTASKEKSRRIQIMSYWNSNIELSNYERKRLPSFLTNEIVTGRVSVFLPYYGFGIVILDKKYHYLLPPDSDEQIFIPKKSIIPTISQNKIKPLQSNYKIIGPHLFPNERIQFRIRQFVVPTNPSNTDTDTNTDTNNVSAVHGASSDEAVANLRLEAAHVKFENGLTVPPLRHNYLKETLTMIYTNLGTDVAAIFKSYINGTNKNTNTNNNDTTNSETTSTTTATAATNTTTTTTEQQLYAKLNDVYTRADINIKHCYETIKCAGMDVDNTTHFEPFNMFPKKKRK